MAIIRAGLVALCLLVGAGVALLAAPFCTPGGRAARILARLFCRTMLRLLRIRVEVDGTPPGPRDGHLVAANHISWIDPLVLLAVMPASALAKREVGTWPGIGALARLQATVFVDRRRRRGIPRVNRELAERLRHSRNVLLFPEGTTHDGETRGRFLTSHLACLVSLMDLDPGRRTATARAVALAYSTRAAAWIGDDTLLPHLWSVLRGPGMICRVAFGTPHQIQRGYDRKILGRTLATDVETLLGAPPVSQETCKRQKPAPAGGLIVTQT